MFYAIKNSLYAAKSNDIVLIFSAYPPNLKPRTRFWKLGRTVSSTTDNSFSPNIQKRGRLPVLLQISLAWGYSVGVSRPFNETESPVEFSESSSMHVDFRVREKCLTKGCDHFVSCAF